MNPWDNYTSGTDWWKQQAQGYQSPDEEDLYNRLMRPGFNQWESSLNYYEKPDIVYGMLSAAVGPHEAQRQNNGGEIRNGIRYSGVPLNDRINEGYRQERAPNQTPVFPPMYSGRSLWDQISTTRGY